MKKTALRITAAAALVALGAPAFAITMDGNIEFDNTYLNDADGVKRGLEQGGRVEFNVAGKAGPNVFIAGRASFLAKKDGTVATDDMWVQVGNAMADLKLGRFEAADLFPLPRDVLVLYSGVAPYRANLLRGRFGNAGNGQGVFHAAGTFNAGGGLSVELGVVEAEKDTVAAKGFRPVVSYAAGPLTLRAGIEAVKLAGGNSETGFGLTGSYNLGGVTLLGNYAHIKIDDAKSDTFGIIANADFGLAGGVIIGKTKAPGIEAYKTQTVYAAYNIPFFDIKGAVISPALSFSKGSGSNTASDQKGLRLRFFYTF